MLDIGFYLENDSSKFIEIPEPLYEWLAHTSFSKISLAKEAEDIYF